MKRFWRAWILEYPEEGSASVCPDSVTAARAIGADLLGCRPSEVDVSLTKRKELAIHLPPHLLQLLANVVAQLADYRTVCWAETDRRHALMQELDAALQPQIPEELELSPRQRRPPAAPRREQTVIKLDWHPIPPPEEAAGVFQINLPIGAEILYSGGHEDALLVRFDTEREWQPARFQWVRIGDMEEPELAEPVTGAIADNCQLYRLWGSPPETLACEVATAENVATEAAVLEEQTAACGVPVPTVEVEVRVHGARP